MNDLVSISAITPLRQRLIDDMEVRRFSRETQRNYIRDIGRFATFLRRSPDTATAEDFRRFQIEQLDAGVPVPTMNSIVSALRFFFIYTINSLTGNSLTGFANGQSSRRHDYSLAKKLY
jgi:site-specific recombinase XerD